jgi:integrase
MFASSPLQTSRRTLSNGASGLLGALPGRCSWSANGRARARIFQFVLVKSNEGSFLLWKACRDDDFGTIVRLLILTGQRREEVGGMADSEISIEKRLWSLPRSRTKNALPHDIPLSDTALALLAQHPRRPGRDLIFGDTASRPFSGWSRARRALDVRLGGIAPLAPWVLHDIRRSVATRLADLGTQPHVIEALLNHISGHKGGVAGIYNRATYANEKRQALDLWAAHVEALLADKPLNVVPIRA